jgi:GT2 family glycosyltransferase
MQVPSGTFDNEAPLSEAVTPIAPEEIRSTEPEATQNGDGPDPVSAIEVIRQSGQFDHEFYLRANPDVQYAGIDPIEHYVSSGSAEGRRPNEAFDPIFYRAEYQDVAASGMEPFHHYLAVGRAENRVVSGGGREAAAEAEPSLPAADVASAVEVIRQSGQFDREFYLRANPDVRQAGLDPIAHYVASGSAEGRRPNEAFDPAFYRTEYADVASSGMDPFHHYLVIGMTENRAASKEARDAAAEDEPKIGAADTGSNAIGAIRRSGQFDREFYLRINQDVRQAGIDPLEHYVVSGSQEGRRPNEDFDPAFYRTEYADVADSGMEPFHHYLTIGRTQKRATSKIDLLTRASYDAVRASGLFDERFYRESIPWLGSWVDAVKHYLTCGFDHHIDPGPKFDSPFYYSRHPEARAGLAPLLQYILYGKKAGWPIQPSGSYHWVESPPRPDTDIHIERLRAESFFYRYGFHNTGNAALRYCVAATADIGGRAPPGRGLDPEPDVSIIIPVYGQVPYVLSCLDSLSRHSSRYSFEVIVYDDASPSEMKTECLREIPWIRYIDGRPNKGFIGACNSAAALAKGRYLVFLNSDTRVGLGWLDELIGTFADRPQAGLVGSKLFNDDGTLQEAGAIVWQDGSAWNYGRGDDPNAPQYCFARQTDYCSGAAIAAPRDLFEELGGFDVYYTPAYYEDVDFAFRVRAAGRQVWYQSLSRVLHYEGKSHGRDVRSGIKAYQVKNARKFTERWRATLRDHRKNGELPLLESNRQQSFRMLALDAVTPTPDQDAGSVMTLRLLQIYEKMGWQISFLAVQSPLYDPRYSADMQRSGIETFSVPAVRTVEDVLRQRPNFYDAVLGFRVPVLGGLFDRLRSAYPTALMLFHDIDLHYLRMQREAKVKNDARMTRRAELIKDEELALVAKADCTIVPSQTEKEILEAEVGVKNVIVYSYTADLRPSEVPYNERTDIVFLGGFRHLPNIDAVDYFVREIWPALVAHIPPEAKFYVVGPYAPDSLVQLASERVIFTGYLEQLEPVLDGCRVFVAPLRFGAGLKGKLVTALSYGVPCVASSIAAEGMDLTPGEHVLVADDPDTFVAEIARLYHDPVIWAGLQEAGYGFVAERYSWEAGTKVAEDILEMANDAWINRRGLVRKARIAALLDPESALIAESEAKGG